LDKKIESANRNSFMSVSKMWVSLHRFSQKSPSHNTFLWTSPVLNFKKLDENAEKGQIFRKICLSLN
jgi:hypothetical protein